MLIIGSLNYSKGFRFNAYPSTAPDDMSVFSSRKRTAVTPLCESCTARGIKKYYHLQEGSYIMVKYKKFNITIWVEFHLKDSNPE